MCHSATCCLLQVIPFKVKVRIIIINMQTAKQLNFVHKIIKNQNWKKWKCCLSCGRLFICHVPLNVLSGNINYDSWHNLTKKLWQICRKSNVDKIKSKDDICFQDSGTMSADKNYWKLWEICSKSNIEKRKSLIKSKDELCFQDGGWMSCKQKK